jgi:hypothetical protein
MALSPALLLGGCGGGIEPGMPTNIQAPPPDFDPGGAAKPDMTGKAAKPKS